LGWEAMVQRLVTESGLNPPTPLKGG